MLESQYVDVAGTKFKVTPKPLLCYIEKLEYIKSRRRTIWQLLAGMPKSDGVSPEKFDNLFKIACETVYHHSSFVSLEEELEFDRSQEGIMFRLWQGTDRLENENPVAGVGRIAKLWQSATSQEQTQMLVIMNQRDQRAMSKNSDGPSESQDDSSGNNSQ